MFVCRLLLLVGGMNARKEYRKKWIANKRKIQRDKRTHTRAVALSDSDSDTNDVAYGVAMQDDGHCEVEQVELSEVVSELSGRPRVPEPDDTSWDLIDYECDRVYLYDSDETDVEQQEHLTESLRTWVTDTGVPHVHVNKLLRILKPLHPELPLTSATLLKTTQTVQCRSVSGGNYIYLGFHDALVEIAARNTSVVELQLALNVDGVPLFASSKYSLWPVLCSVMNVAHRQVFVVALYGGYSKPSDLHFLDESVSELQVLVRDGLTCDGRKIACTAKMCVCDAVARAMVKRIKQFSGYYGCDKCQQKGYYIGRMTFPNINSPLRTDSSFRCRANADHHTGSSPFLDLPVDMIDFFPIDYMHQVCLGVAKRLLLCWTCGGKKVRLSHSQQSQIDQRLNAFRSSVTNEFSRKPRSLSELKYWKATEFRTFILYIGYFCLRGIINDEILKHFMCFSVGIAILVSQSLCDNDRLKQFSNDLLLYFVNEAKELYGPEFLVYNVHSLVHLSAEVDHFGALDNSGAFIFENFMQVLKRSVKSTKKPVLQVANRLQEKAAFSKDSFEPFALETMLYQYPARAPNNSCILEDGRCCQVISVDREAVLCMLFADAQPLYTHPCDSRILGVCRVRLSSGILRHLPRSTVAKKAMSYVDSVRSEILFFKLMHSA